MLKIGNICIKYLTSNTFCLSKHGSHLRSSIRKISLTHLVVLLQFIFTKILGHTQDICSIAVTRLSNQFFLSFTDLGHCTYNVDHFPNFKQMTIALLSCRIFSWDLSTCWSTNEESKLPRDGTIWRPIFLAKRLVGQIPFILALPCTWSHLQKEVLL